MECMLGWQKKDSTLWPEVSYEIKPLKVWAFLELMNCWDGAPTEGLPEEGNAPSRILKSGPMLEVAKQVIPEHARNLKGLNIIRDGERIEGTLEEVCEEAMLLPLAMEMIAGLIEISEVRGEKEKK